MPYVRRIRPLITAKCAANNCGVEFVRKTLWQKYCREICRHRANYNPEAQRFRMMFCQYGLRRADYNILFTKGCWLCGKPFVENEIPNVEHDHVTQIVRGLAHSACNTIIGHAKENPELLEAIAHALRVKTISV